MNRGTETSAQIVRDRRDPAAVEHLLRLLPEWFGIEDATRQYIEDSQTKPNYLAIDPSSGDVVGVLLTTAHNPLSAEIHLMAVAPQFHRRGIGRALVDAAESDMRASGVQLSQVKTLGPSRPDEGYARTTQFYRAMGYLPLEEINGLWGANPCLILVKQL